MPILLKPSQLFLAISLFLFATCLSGTALAQSNQAAQDDDRPQAMMIMDFSGSMWGAVNGSAKFQVLNDIVERNFDEWNQSLELGVLAYGHRRKGDCRDIELAFRPGEASSREMRNWVTQQQPVGKTPLGNSLVTASAYFNNKGQEANLIVLSDGIESCGVDPCRIIQELQADGAKLTAHVIGFDLNARDAIQIRCIADLTGGTYVDANRADQLVDGFRKAVESIAVKDDGAEKALRETLDKSLDALRETSDQLDDANLRAEEALENLAAANQELARLTSALQDQEETIEDLEAALVDCKEEVARLEAEIARLNDVIADRDAKIAGLSDEIARLGALLDVANNTVADRDQELAARQETIDAQEDEIEDLNDDLDDASASIAALNEDNDRLQTLLDRALRNRQLTVSSLDFGAFSGTTEPVDIAALVAERDAYLAALQSLRQSLSFILDPLSQAQAIANTIPEEGNRIAVPDELNEVLVLLAPGVEGEMPDLQWTMAGASESVADFRDTGAGARIPLPEQAGMFDIGLNLPGYEATLTIENDPANPSSRRMDLNIGRLRLHLPGSQAGVFFVTIKDAEDNVIAKQPVETSGTRYFAPGIYRVKAQSEQGIDEFEVQIYAGKETSVPLRF